VGGGRRKTGQSGPDYWAQALPDRVAADCIVNRLANNARSINLGQVDMRRQRGQQARATAATGNSRPGDRVARLRPTATRSPESCYQEAGCQIPGVSLQPVSQVR
jgi:hypothetical protein